MIPAPAHLGRSHDASVPWHRPAGGRPPGPVPRRRLLEEGRRAAQLRRPDRDGLRPRQGLGGALQTLAVAITQYVSAEGSLPEAEDVDQLAALLAPTFVRRAPRVDPWGTAYAYQTDGQSYWITSAGHDRELDTADDVEVEDGQVTKLPEGYERIR
jgi:hypothetical protein